MNINMRAELLIMIILTYFIAGSINCSPYKKSKSITGFRAENPSSITNSRYKMPSFTIFSFRNRRKIKAEKEKYKREFMEENDKYRKEKARIAEVEKYYEAMMKQMIRPVEDYINKTKGEARSLSPNNDSIKSSQDVLVPTPEETIGIIFVAYLGFWISVKLKVCSMAYELSGENKKISDQCETQFKVMKNAVDSVFRDFLPRFRRVSKPMVIKYYSSEIFSKNITADEIARELSCLDLNFVIKTNTPNIMKPNSNCPFNIIQWQNMRSVKWRNYFSTDAILHRESHHISYFFSEIDSALIRVINLIELRNVQRYFSALLNCKTNVLIIDEVRDRYFPFNHYTEKNFIDAIIEKKLEKTANPIETLLSVVKVWIEKDMEQIKKRKIDLQS